MGSGSILRKSLVLFGLASLTLLSGCLQFETGNTVSWAPSGRRLAFISRGAAWVYDMQSGEIGPLPSRREPSGVSWSPREDAIATSTAGLVEIFTEQSGGVFTSSRAFVMPFLGSDALSLLVWNPSGAKLLNAQIGDRMAETTEIDLAAREAVKLGPGVGLYGSGAQWLLWAAHAPVGKNEDKIVFDRQSPGGASLALALEAVHVLEGGFFDTLTTAQDQTSRQPICARREDSPHTRTDFYCLDEQGELRRRAALPVVGQIFPDARRRLFAVIDDKNEEAPTLKIYDADGRLRAEAGKFLKAVRDGAAAEADGEQKTLRVSRLAWSPDGNWLAWIVNGRLCLWNWRNDVVRIHAPPA